MDFLKRTRQLQLAGVVLALLALTGCGGCNRKSPAGGSCETADNCQSGECVGGVCTDCTRGANACVCLDNNTCNAGSACTGGVCQTCSDGAQSCPCRGDGTCESGLRCQAGTCVGGACVDGTESCPCRSGSVCDTGLSCLPNNTCATCSNEVAGCPCTAGACRGGLVCDVMTTRCRDVQTCASLGCAAAHRRCAAGTPGMDARCLDDCETGFVWNTATMVCDPVANANCTAGAAGSILADCDSQNRACTPNGTTASCTTCKANFTDDGGSLVTCRAVVTCATLATTCDAQNRDCTPNTANADAVCGGCKTGFNLMGNACVAIPTGNCVVDAGGGLEATCTTRGRACEETVPNQAACGACLAGLVESGPDPLPCVMPANCETLGCAALGRSCGAAACGGCITGLIPTVPGDNTSACRLPRGCDTLTCGGNEFCNDGVPGQDAVCATRPCADPNQALRVDTNACVTCPGTCGQPGEAPRFWPYTVSQSNRCICETLPGYFYDLAGISAARPCDDDADGWVNVAAKALVEGTDPTLRSNARCRVRTVDRVTLENEYRQRLDILLCDSGPQPSTAGACITPAPQALYESSRNDQQREVDNAAENNVPVYDFNGTGRRLRASEINPLTKACVSKTADYNDNAVSDVDEHQKLASLDVLGKFAHFVELHTSGYEPPVAGLFGRLTIKERSRCEMGFALQYDPADGDYWRNCQRKRDASFNIQPGGPTIGLDFASWSCAGAQGSCPTAPPPALPPMAGVGVIPPHGLCQVPSNTLPPADNVWRGMNHHSQFKCVVIDPNNQPTQEGQQSRRRANDLYDGANTQREQFNRCRVECPVGDLACAADCTAGGCTTSSLAPQAPFTAINPDQPRVTCSTVNTNVMTDDVGFVAIRQAGRGAVYSTGCINEYDEVGYKELCPGYLANPLAINGDSRVNNFGELVCGCNLNFGGAACDIPCTDVDLFRESTYDPATRIGYWMCATPAASSNPVISGGGYTLNGQVPARVVPTTALCQDAQNCNTGYAIKPF
jgi:hypothetical protein